MHFVVSNIVPVVDKVNVTWWLREAAQLLAFIIGNNAVLAAYQVGLRASMIDHSLSLSRYARVSGLSVPLGFPPEEAGETASLGLCVPQSKGGR